MSDFSFEGVERRMEEEFGEIFRAPLSPEQEQNARKMIEQAESHRLELWHGTREMALCRSCEVCKGRATRKILPKS